jgi:hypothetical protein
MIFLLGVASTCLDLHNQGHRLAAYVNPVSRSDVNVHEESVHSFLEGATSTLEGKVF